MVVTSSVAAILYGRDGEIDENFSFNEDHWTDVNHKHTSAYAKSKTYAEKAAWEFIENDSSGMELSVVNPAMVFGPVLEEDYGTSVGVILELMSGKYPVVPNMDMGVVDVRDVAAAHILAMQNPSSNGERFALSEKDLWYKDVAKLLRKNGFDKAPKINLPKWTAKFLANFSNEIKFALPNIGRVRSVKNTSKAKDVLGWNPRSAEESILEIANQIKDMGLIK